MMPEAAAPQEPVVEEWDTHREVMFIDWLSHKENDPSSFLRKYLNAASRRQQWDDIDPDVVISHAQMKLNEIERREATA